MHSLTGETTSVVGAGRTDAGVHAYGQVAHFMTTSRIHAERFAPSELTVVVVGDVEASRAAARAAQVFGDWLGMSAGDVKGLREEGVV